MRNIVRRDLIFLAPGTGIAPVKAMLETLPDMSSDQMPKSVTVLWGGRHEQDLYFDLESLPGTFRYIPVLSRSATWKGKRGYIQDVLLRSKSDLYESTVYACGSAAMIQSAKDVFTAAGLPTEHFHYDAFVCSSAIKS
jgi:CDP-4-dehydro-6-deoxyglucose reductase